jgi:hypothetical protein
MCSQYKILAERYEQVQEALDFSKIPGKLENRAKEFAVIVKYIKNSTSLKVLSLPAQYQYEQDLQQLAGCRVYSFGTDANIRVPLKVATKLDPNKVKAYLTGSGADINAIVANPLDYRFTGMNGKGKGEQVKLPVGKLDIIDLDYTGMPEIYKDSEIVLDGKPLKKQWYFNYVQRAVPLVRNGGLICVTYTLVNHMNMNYSKMVNKADILNDPEQAGYATVYNKSAKLAWFNKNPTKQQIDVFKNSKKDQLDKWMYDTLGTGQKNPALSRAREGLKAADEITNQIQGNCNVSPVFWNIYRGGANSVMYRGVFRT